MKKLVLVLLIALTMSNGYSQISNEKKAELIRLFELGTEQLESGHFKSADSILTKSLDLQLRFATIFNRGIARINLQDTCGFCSDIGLASQFDDDLAQKLFYGYCSKSDTTYYNKEMLISNKHNGRYYKLYKTFKCSTDSIVEIHDLKKKVEYIKLLPGHFSMSTSDLVCAFRIEGKQETYHFTEDYPRIRSYVGNFSTYIKENTSIPMEILNGLIVKHIVTKGGKILDVQVFKDKEKRDDYATEIARILNTISHIKPSTYKKLPVDREVIYGF